MSGRKLCCVLNCECGAPLGLQDRTFGLKNKKGKKQQTFIKQVTNQVKFGGQQSIAKVSMFADKVSAVVGTNWNAENFSFLLTPNLARSRCLPTQGKL